PADLKKLAVAGQLKPTDMVLCQGQAQWVAASTVKPLWAPVPAAQKATFEFGAANAAEKTRPARRGRGKMLLLVAMLFFFLGAAVPALLGLHWLGIVEVPGLAQYLPPRQTG